MRRGIGLLFVVAYAAVVAAVVLAVGCSDGAPPAGGNTPNLLAEGLVFSADMAPAGGAVGMERTLRNDGTTDAGEFLVEYYLSPDTELDTAVDHLAATESVSRLAAGEENTRPVTLACPGSTGGFHCIAVIDRAEAVHEIDEGDNLAVSAAAVTVCGAPNLRAEGAAVLPSPATRAGREVQIVSTFRETESGLDVETGFDVTALLSEDEALHPSDDLPLGVATWGPLAAGASGEASMTVTIPELMLPGRWYVGGFVDSSGAVDESDETDNADTGTGLAFVDVLPPPTAPGETDLVAYDSRAALPWNGSTYELAGGSSLLCLVDVLSMGEPPAGEFRIGVYFSDDDALTTGDLLVGSAMVTAERIARGPVAIECRAPDVAAGTTFRWGAIVDDGGAVAETDETNNTHVNWDLEIVSAPAVDLAAAFINDGPPIMAMELGEPRAVNFSLVCSGGTESGYFTVKFYISPDAEITGDPAGDDMEVGYRWFPYLPAGYSSVAMGRPEWATVEVPAGTPPGNYRLGYIVDLFDQVAEADEANNVRLYPAPVAVVEAGAPDLVVVMHDIALPETGGPVTRQAASGATDATWPLISVGNYGTLAAPSVPVNIHAASSETTDPATDPLIGTVDTGVLGAGRFRKLTDVRLDVSGLAPGTHRLYACIDPAGSVAEADETNNTSDSLQIGAFVFGGWVTLEVGSASPNLTATASPDSGAVVDAGEGTRLWLTWEVTNTSLTEHAKPSAVTLWLSRDAEPSVSAGDIYLLLDDVGRLAPATAFRKHRGVEIPFPPEIGTTWRIKAMADSVGEVAEADEDDNVSAGAAFTIVAQP